MIKDLQIIKGFEKQIRILDTEISRLTDERNKLYKKMGDMSDKIAKYSRYNTEEIAEVIRELMQSVEGISYTIVNGTKLDVDSIIIKPKDNIAGAEFRLPSNKTCSLEPNDVLDNSKKNIYVYEFINFVYKERSKACMEEIDYAELSAILSEYLEIIKKDENGKKLIKL